ncbi:MAG: peroxidase-related enzyme [Candidatus Heimdallarchaeota archaeon]
MPWIKVLDESDAKGRLKTVYTEVKARRGKISNLMRVYSLNPRALKAYSDLYVCLMIGQSSLSREDRELIATAVSTINDSEYGKLHHGEGLNYYWKNRKRIQQFMDDLNSVYLPDKARTMLNYVTKLTKKPGTIEEGDIQKLREVGFSDEDILNINLITSYFNFENRVAKGLGVTATPDEMDSRLML